MKWQRFTIDAEGMSKLTAWAMIHAGYSYVITHDPELAPAPTYSASRKLVDADHPFNIERDGRDYRVGLKPGVAPLKLDKMDPLIDPIGWYDSFHKADMAVRRLARGLQ